MSRCDSADTNIGTRGMAMTGNGGLRQLRAMSRMNAMYRRSSGAIRVGASGDSKVSDALPSSADVVVIGSGLGGLCCAALLSSKGKKVQKENPICLSVCLSICLSLRVCVRACVSVSVSVSVDVSVDVSECVCMRLSGCVCILFCL